MSRAEFPKIKKYFLYSTPLMKPYSILICKSITILMQNIAFTIMLMSLFINTIQKKLAPCLNMTQVLNFVVWPSEMEVLIPKMKVVKRIMYGRNSFDLLKSKLL